MLQRAVLSGRDDVLEIVVRMIIGTQSDHIGKGPARVLVDRDLSRAIR
jgi:hypothetical protein